jgi:uncharacterized DUF497 family protein
MVFIRRLLWDAWNVAHIARHQVTPEEVEEVCHGDPVVRAGYRGRIVLIGPTGRGRILSVILAPLGRGVYYPVTAFPASRRMRRSYHPEKGGGHP